jgi:tetratricopeptide (TPR) repeat protein
MSTGDARAQLAHGHALYRQGRLGEAAATLRRLLADQPHNSQALHLLGITVGQMGRAGEAVELIRTAVRLEPSNPIMHANLGNALQETGRHAEAAEEYGRAIALKADFAGAHRGLGVALVYLGHAEEGLASLEQALRLVPADAQIHNDLGAALQQLGRSREALAHFVRAAALNPRHVEAHHNRAMTEMSLGLYTQALASIDSALALDPSRAAALADRGNILRALGRNDEAVAAYDRALAVAPGALRVHHKRGLALLGMERHVEALASFDRALAIRADDFAAHFHRGVALALLERHEEALASFDRAIALNGAPAEPFNNRGIQLSQLDRHEEALVAFAAAATRNPGHVEAYSNAGTLLQSLGRFDEALAQAERALAIEPGYAPAEWSTGLIKLTRGDFAAGWPLYESRLRLAYLRPYHRDLAVPRWSGDEPIAGRRVLVHAEQGIGDALQFCRYVPLLEARGAQVFFEVLPPLRKLMGSLGMRGTLQTAGEPLPQVDCYCPLLSLPLALRTQLETIPGGGAYLRAETGAVDEWRGRLESLPGLKVGLNWQGHAGAEKQLWVRGRSFSLECLAPLARVSGVSLVSLQKGEAAAQRAQVEFGGALAQLTDPLDTGPDAMLETAALMKALDLVITSDTAVAHLAGALGVPVWVVLKAVPDWRWMLERSDSPWYPTMRLYRQRVAGDWHEVLERVAGDVAALIDSRHAAAVTRSPESQAP